MIQFVDSLQTYPSILNGREWLNKERKLRPVLLLSAFPGLDIRSLSKAGLRRMDSTCSLAPETEACRNAFLLFTPELIVNRLLAKKEESRSTLFLIESSLVRYFAFQNLSHLSLDPWILTLLIPLRVSLARTRFSLLKLITQLEALLHHNSSTVKVSSHS